MMNDSILVLFEGLTVKEAREFRRAIIPALQNVRAEIIEKREEKAISKAETSRGNTDAMQSENEKR